MKRTVGTVVRGIRTPIIKTGDNLASIVVESVLDASKHENFEMRDKDVIAITEAVVSISQNNYVSVDEVALDIKTKYPKGHIGIIFPILSRNRFSLILKGIARGSNKITMLLSYPSDEVGNKLFDEELLEIHNINPYSDVITESYYNEHFRHIKHPFTGMNYVDLYESIAKEENCEIEFIFANNPAAILNYTKEILTCDIHTQEKTMNKLKKNNQDITLYSFSEILNKSVNGSAYNSKYGLMGSNISTEERLKLFPENGDVLIHEVQQQILDRTGKHIEVMVYGDGAFCDPIGHIWELADPVVSPFYTSGLEGTPNEIKLKYVSDNQLNNLTGSDLDEAMRNEIRKKASNLKGSNITLGTTPRRLTDLIGSLCDLTSGSGDKGTPVVLVQGYFDSYAEEK